MKMQTWILLAILLLGLWVRLYKLTSVPPSPSLDEVSIGYNAYSILKTGKDEYGALYPVLLRAYDDWRPALYVYTVIPFVATLGLSSLAVRLPAVIFAVGSIFLTYLLVIRLFDFRKDKGTLALIAAALVAVSPWHVYLSRLGHEVNLGNFMVLFAIFMFLKAIEKPRLLPLAAIAFAVTLYTYQSEKIVIPLLLVVLAWIYRKKLLSQKKIVTVSVLLGSVIVLPLLKVSFTPEALLRFRATSVFSNNPLYELASQKRQSAHAKGDIPGELFFSKAVTTAYIFSSQYVSHLSPGWLFIGAAREAHKIPYTGLLYPWEALFFVMGLVWFWQHRRSTESGQFLFVWLLVSILPGAITTQAPHAMRTFTTIPIWQIFIALGIAIMIEELNRKRKTQFALSLFIVVALFGSLAWRNYFVTFRNEQSDSFQYALGKAIEAVMQKQDSWDHIVFSNSGDLYQSYMFFLFYTAFDPSRYQELGGTVSGGYEQTHRIGKYEFRPIRWSEEAAGLYIGKTNDFPAGAGGDTVTNLDHYPAIQIVERE